MKTQINLFLKELKHEAEKTRRILACVPEDQKDWKPHAKSMSLGGLAIHLSEIPSWLTMTLNTSGLDFSAQAYTPTPFTSTAELLAGFDKGLSEAVERLEKATDKELEDIWTMRNGDAVFFSLPKADVLREWSFNHVVHHRAQLGVYLRLLNIPLPGTYGPSADTN